MFRAYIRHLENLVLTGAKPDWLWQQRCANALNGEFDRKMRESVALTTRRRLGAFFTGSVLARHTLSTCAQKGSPRIFDPACGGGDLLIAATDHLPICNTVTETAKLWSSHLSGCDIRTDFVRTTKIRLLLQALKRGTRPNGDLSHLLEECFPKIVVADGLKQREYFENANWVVMNPPFCIRPAAEDCLWASGGITAAAQFLETAIQISKPETQVTAILPEVIRSGSRYRTLWGHVQACIHVRKCRSLGLFATADVHVFLLDSLVRTKRTCKPRRVRPKSSVLASQFDVHVGPVVPFRHPKTGDVHPYIHAKGLPKWNTVKAIQEHRNFSGTTYTGPFLVIRRTSRPEDPHRAIATVICTRGQVAVENHLIICSPKDRRVETCMRLMAFLQTRAASDWLNRRIRCRHLTVDAIKSIPFH